MYQPATMPTEVKIAAFTVAEYMKRHGVSQLCGLELAVPKHDMLTQIVNEVLAQAGPMENRDATAAHMISCLKAFL